MARSSSTILTKFISATTIVTAEVANKWYGGLYGSPEGAACDEDDPLVAGHVHDGQHIDGHAQKIHLVNHVTSQLTNPNLADDAVEKRNVRSFLIQGSAIPEYEDIDGDRYYYLDLSILRSEIGGGGAFATASNITSNSPGDFQLDNFVFGSPSLDDDGMTEHDDRIIFDKLKGAFRAGRATSIQWDDANRGSQSTAFGRDNIVQAARSTIAGGETNVILGTGPQSFIGAGDTNVVEGTNCAIVGGRTNRVHPNCIESFIGGGVSNAIESATNQAGIAAGNGNSIESGANQSVIAGGNANIIETSTSEAFIGGGSTNRVRSLSSSSGILSGVRNTVGNGSLATQYSSISSGTDNIVQSNYSFVGSGRDNIIGETDGVDPVVPTLYSGILSGRDNLVYGSQYGLIGGGFSNTVQKTITDVPADYSGVVSGSGNSVRSSYSVIGGGQNNLIDEVSGVTPTHASIWGGQDHQTISTHTTIVGGQNNTINSASSHSSIVGGASHVVGSDYAAVIAGVQGIINPGCIGSVILGGMNNSISSSLTSVTISGNTTSITNSNYSTILNGPANIITNAPYSTIMGGKYAEATHSGSFVFGTASATNVPPGTHQTFRVHWVGITNDGNLSEIFIDRSSERLTIPNHTSYHFHIRFCARRYDPSLEVADFEVDGVITKDDTAGTTNLHAVTANIIHNAVGYSSPLVSADQTNGSLKVQVQGAAGDTVVWMASGVIYRLTAEAGVGGDIGDGDIIVFPDPDDPVTPGDPGGGGPGWKLPPDREVTPPELRESFGILQEQQG